MMILFYILLSLILFSSNSKTQFAVAFATRREGVAKLLSSVEKVNGDKTKLINSYPDIPDDLKDCFTSNEWQQRCSLAVSYRIAYMHDWHENIFNHITLKVDGSDNEPNGPYFLLNDYGLGFDEITASNLLKVNLDGVVVKPPNPIPVERRAINPGDGRVFKPGYVLHSAIHSARQDVVSLKCCIDTMFTTISAYIIYSHFTPSMRYGTDMLLIAQL